uniref:Checkpoint protein kinase n=1 Tax=Antonospora locustae TaxID=278021 RepID=Q95VS7_ANTLO|nr:checkpoint protein kinase [Antonospora locustae]|eukprot:jgi/Antlo1/1655/2176
MANYKIFETLASGSTSKVKKGVDDNKQKFAIKIISKTFKSTKEVQKEIRIHRSLSHPNILKFIDFYEDESNFYIVLSLAPRELMDLIEIGVGLPHELAHFYFRQLVSAVKHLHEMGICHRDIKADNLLIDKNGNLLLADFGFATLYVYKGKRRKMRSVVGSYMYMAPEVLCGKYEGDKADIWSCGLVLLIMHTGVLAWNEPTMEDPRFEAYVKLKYHNYSPFNRIPFVVLSLIKRMLTVDPCKRIQITEIENSEWFAGDNALMDENGLCTDRARLAKHMEYQCTGIIFSQPGTVQCNQKTNFVLSQPTVVDNTPSLRRIYVFRDEKTVLEKIQALLAENVVQYVAEDSVIAFSTADRKRGVLSGEISTKNISNVCCITFRKLRGCSLEFKTLVTILADGIKAAFPHNSAT